jgi:hypothetical protein
MSVKEETMFKGKPQSRDLKSADNLVKALLVDHYEVFFLTEGSIEELKQLVGDEHFEFLTVTLPAGDFYRIDSMVVVSEENLGAVIAIHHPETPDEMFHRLENLIAHDNLSLNTGFRL